MEKDKDGSNRFEVGAYDCFGVVLKSHVFVLVCETQKDLMKKQKELIKALRYSAFYLVLLRFFFLPSVQVKPLRQFQQQQ